MADIDNLTVINENFDTVKTLLNSIRAQGILNTSDVDKLLSGINSKLDKINTDEDIDRIKVYLTELKQNLDERHNILVSKFGAIEALFSNLLKNSNELPKSSELKELFDVVATNLSVFSREVVSQKETLTDITLRLDAIRSDDSQKKDIIKNITLLKPDLERLNNGFDSIVLSLNDNFKTIVKTISSIDKSEYLDRFSSSLSDIDMSNKAIVSAIQILDKKSENVEESLENLVTKSDFDKTDKNINEIKLINQSINDNINDISSRYARIDALADKVDASVNIIATLKSVLENSDNENTSKIVEKLDSLNLELTKISDSTKLDEVRVSIEGLIKDITENIAVVDKNIKLSSNDIESILSNLKTLDIQTGLDSVVSKLNNAEDIIKTCITENTNKINTLNDAGLSRILDNITTNADSLNAKLNQTNSEIVMFCENNFDTIASNISELKNIVSQIDDNGVSANNAMFSNITDRMDLFENTLKSSLEFQENSSSASSSKLYEQIDLIKNVSNVLDYKMDSSVVEISEMKRAFESLKESVNSVLAIDFNGSVKDLRADLYASKQDMTAAFDSAENELSEKLTNDIYAKYELIISKIDSMEDGLKNIQSSAMIGIKELLEKISGSLVDVLSYVSESREFPYEDFDRKLETIASSIKESDINYVENVRDIVDLIRAQVDVNLKSIEEESAKRLDSLGLSLNENTESLKSSIKNSYEKLLEIKSLYEELKSISDENGIDRQERFEKIIAKASSLEESFDVKLSSLKNSLLDKVTEFKQEFTVENADKINEFKFAVENLNNRNSKEVFDVVDSIKSEIKDLSVENSAARGLALDSIITNFNSLKELLNDTSSKNSEARAKGLELISDDFNEIKKSINNLRTENNDLRDTAFDKIKEKFALIESKLESSFNELTGARSEISGKLYEELSEIKTAIESKSEDASKARTSTFAKILENFTGIKDFVTVTNDKMTEEFLAKIQELKDEFENSKKLLNEIDENIDGDLTRQLSIIESNFESLISQINILSEKTENDLSAIIKNEFSDISYQMNEKLAEKLEDYKSKIEETFDKVSEAARADSDYIKQKVSEMNSDMKIVWGEQADANYNQILQFTETLKAALDERIKLSESDYNALRAEIDEFTRKLELNNEVLTNSFKERLDEITKYVGSVIDIQAEETNVKYGELKALSDDQISLITSAKEGLSTLKEQLKTTSDVISDIKEALASSSEEIKAISADNSTQQIRTIEESADKIREQLELAKQSIQAGKDFVSEFMKKELALVSESVEKETDIILAEVIEQFEQLKKSNNDEFLNLASNIENAVSEHIYNNIEDLKSYFDVKTDSAVLSDKLDMLKTDVTAFFGNITTSLGRMLESDAFANAISDFRLANELLINTAVENANDKIESFIKDSAGDIAGVIAGSGKDLSDKLALFDKKFTDTIVDKYEEIKLISNNYNSAFEDIKQSIYSTSDEFNNLKSGISEKVCEIVAAIDDAYNKSASDISELKRCFDGLREQISNKTFEEAFQNSLNKQISSMESMINEQMSYLEDINELCSVNLPDVTELGTLVKGAVLETLNNLSRKIEEQNIGEIVENEINGVKSEIITQILNIFNQISFVTEEEEILDFIQEKHDELISVLSHIVTSSSEIGMIKDGVSDIENSVTNLRDDINVINEKLDNIISSSGDSDYIYSLQDIESDIANLRVSIQEIKDSSSSDKKELSDLISAAEKVSTALEEFKEIIPSKSDLGGIAEDIVSISTRTNKLILASDESYKTLQENLQEFKLVINDLDERTRNFAQESGMDRIDSKLNTLNSLVQNGAKSNQVFNEVFEYLAEWVDKAGNQIDTITNKVETLDDIGQIKVMLEDLKAESADNSESVELIEALSNVFDKQAKKISSLESKLDKMIVETTIAGKNNKIDMKPMEETLNKFLVAMDEKISSQQDKIVSLENKLSNVLGLIDEKDTAALTKKVGGMDKQIAKLNKSIEKIASHVIEK